MKSWQSEWGRFHHALRITVSENGLSEDMMVLKKETAFSILRKREGFSMSL